ncbi:hypothetical protein ACTFIV_005002 [Dictyostelium citrinum]
MNLNNEDNPAIVIDIGSYLCKGGFGGEESPRAIFRSVVGRPNFCNRGVKNGMGQKDCYVGDEAITKKSILSLKCPNELKSPVNWDDVEKILEHTFYNELRVSPSESQGVLLSEIPLNPKENREKITQIMFEQFDTPNFYLANQSVLSLYSKGRINGIVLDSGYNITYSVPIYQGHSIPNSINQLEIAGNSITEYLMKVLNENRGYGFATSSEKDIVNDMKEKNGFISLDYHNDLYSSTISNEIEKSYQLPDGQIISIGKERFICGEVLFEPTLLNIESFGIHELLYNSIIKCDIEMRRELYNNIILSGGTTMLAGINNRLEKELINLSPSSMKIKVIQDNNNNSNNNNKDNNSHLAWIGGSIFSSLSTFEEQSISKQEYNEYGSKIIQRKCF